MSQMSIATIDDPEFINLQPLDINPLMSKCEIKVLYIGQNRNQSFITKEVATEMSKTLRGAPIVGWFKEDKGDFGDHGDRVILDGDGIKFQCMTKPYGFVSPDAEIWFQKFEDTDDFGNKVIREYLMTTGYLWTGQYEEAKLALEGNGHSQSMELDNDTLDGKWSQDLNSGLEFFIINDAIFSKLCILGENVEPCFEGANISKPEVSKTFTKMDDDFRNTLFNMMKDLKFALQGGQVMATVKQDTQVEKPNKDFSIDQDKNEQNVNSENHNINVDINFSSEFKKKDDEEEKDKENTSSDNKNNEDNNQTNKDNNDDNKDDDVKDNDDNTDDDDEEKKKKDKKYSLLEEKFSALEQRYAALEREYQTLVQFKNDIDNEKKDALINSFYMLSDEDKKDVIANKSKYTLDEIEAKLSVICFRKKVSFEDNKENTHDDVNVTTYNLNTTKIDNAPAWVQACRETQSRQNQ